ncbi:MAG: aldo/keto reductase [Candidatus Hydrogenedentes bacterium]|nr:aldo/keto reductase [Candidatus Hydrogenedentota bacterium]
MEQRDIGERCGFRIPRANLGAMRLPADLDVAAALIRKAIDAGMVYIDASRGYENCELKLARALKGGYRKRVILSTKWSPWAMSIDKTNAPSADCVRRRIDEQMKRLEVDYLDYYQIWSINSRDQFDQVVRRGGMLDGIRKAVGEGLVGHIGFTTHDEPESLISYLPEADWCEIILFSYNLLQTRYAPAIAAAHEHGIGTLVMNPVAGGRLAEPSPVLTELAHEVGAVSVPDLAIRYIMSNPNVDTILSGVGKPADIRDSIASVEIGHFSEEQLRRIHQYMAKVSDGAGRLCTGCEYCLPCPAEINIPEVMACVQDERHWGFAVSARARYNRQETGADACTDCGACEEKCTQKLPIRKDMAYARQRFGE